MSIFTYKCNYNIQWLQYKAWEYCEVLLFIVFEICGNVGLYIVFVAVREQSGDVCIVPDTCHSTA